VVLNHVFDGLALLQRFNINDGKVTYQNRFIQSDARKSVVEENRLKFAEFATPADKAGNIFQR
jgi:carotenoid cleavage dioxygenase-like enzyme